MLIFDTDCLKYLYLVFVLFYTLYLFVCFQVVFCEFFVNFLLKNS